VNTLPPPNLPRIDPPIKDKLRRDLHDAVDDLIDAGSELDGAAASRVDEAFVTLLRMARTIHDGKERSLRP